MKNHMSRRTCRTAARIRDEHPAERVVPIVCRGLNC